MRISLVSPGFPPQLGGVEVVVSRLADELSGSGHRVSVYAQRPRGSSFQAGKDYPVRWFADWTGTRQFPVAPGLLRALWRDRKSFDVIHAHSFHALSSMMAATVPQVPLVFTPHFLATGGTRLASAVHIVYDPLARLLFRRAEKVVCVSAAEAEMLLQHYPFIEPRLSIVPIGVDVQAIVTAEPYVADRPVILVAGRLEGYKRVDTAVRAFARMRDKEAEMVVCGTGSQRSALERLARELGVAARVSFLGLVGQEELYRWQRTATVTLSLSPVECFGLVSLEATVAGSRVVASDIPAHAELAKRVGRADAGMILVEPGEAAAAAALDQQLERGRQETLPDLNSDWSAIGRRFEAIYRSVR
jgi:glycosyltransferase involved in cell wall biosynthesis